MFFKYLLLDLDDTLYDYTGCHNKSLEKVFTILAGYSNQTMYELTALYNLTNQKLKFELGFTASSHNKTIYFKHMIDILKLDLSLLIYCEEQYWKCFYENMKYYDGVLEFIIWIKNINIKIAIITDYETEYQIKKLKALDILHYIDVIVTSEEIGKEKPSSHMFLTALNKLGARPEESIMIGDNYEKDIIGSKQLNICNFWFNQRVDDEYTFSSWNELHAKFIRIDTELGKLEYISKYCGERFDLTQAGGGNTSVKYDEFMFIKASGFHLTNINKNDGYVSINNKLLRRDVQDKKTKSITEYNILGKLRGSIETYMHSILKKYTIHLHPIQVNRILISKKCDDFVKCFFHNSLLIEYDTPGVNICNKIMDSYNNEEIIFLKNHGIIITTDVYDNMISTLEYVLEIFEREQHLKLDSYKFVNQISTHINKTHYDNITYLCQDKVINDYFIQKKELFIEEITFPDALIFCGIKILFIDQLDGIDTYFEIYKEYPKVVIINGLIYIINISIQKCKDTEDVLKGNLMVLDNNMEKTYLTNEEICYLNNWDAEKYRKTI